MQRGRLGRVAATAAVGGALLIGLVLVLLIVPSGSYIFLPDRPHPVSPLVTVKGARPAHGTGRIYFVDVLVRKASLLERLWPGIRSGSTLQPASAVNPPGAGDAARAAVDQREMTTSQKVAAAVAERAAGYKVDAKPGGAQIEAVASDGPAAGKLLPTDVVVAVDGKPVRTPDDLRRLVGAHTPGDTVEVSVRRGSGTRTFALATRAAPGQPKRAIIGVFVGQQANIHLPVPVRIDAGDVGGPSAGLAFALEVLSKLGHNVTHGKRVAATGEIELDGTVAPIGGVKQKTLAANDPGSGVDIFLVPAGDNTREARRYASHVRVVPVKTFQQALRALATKPS